MAVDEGPFYTEWYSSVGGFICGHKDSNADENQCVEFRKNYFEDGTEWLECLYLKSHFMRIFV